MSCNAPSNLEWVRRFDIPETIQHEKNFTLYKVTSIVFVKTSPDVVSKVTVWKRYREFRKLYNSIKILYLKLQIKEPLPVFPKRKIFGRFDSEVIEHRRKCALMLLEFIGRHEELYTNELLMKFFDKESLDFVDNVSLISSETSEEDKPNIAKDNENMLIFKDNHFDKNTNSSSILIHDGSDLTEFSNKSPQYLLVAAAHMSAAFRHEAIAEYEEAFIQYKLGTSHLMNGMQTDENSERIKIVQEKIIKYLQRAERLYNRHLNCNISVLLKSKSILKNYKVIDVIGSVILVKDTLQMFTRVIKTVEKFTGTNEEINNFILRGRVPYMIQLYACTETDTTIFLILQHIRRGKLWNFLKSQYHPNIEESNLIKKHSRSRSCNALIQINNFIDDKLSNDFINPINENLENFNENSEDTNELLLKSKKLLSSVNVALRRSCSIASKLNNSEYILSKENNSLMISNKNKNYEKIKFKNSCSTWRSDSISLKEDLENNDSDEDFELYKNEISLDVNDQESNSVFRNYKEFENSTFMNLPNEKCNSENKTLTFKQTESDPDLRKQYWNIPENIVKLWAAEILLALEALHQQNVIIADLRSDNILIDENGHVCLTYIIPRKNWGLLRFKNSYSSPELYMLNPPILLNSSADTWSYGVLLYELLTGYDFQYQNQGIFYSHSIINIPENLSDSAKSLLFKILRYEPCERLTIPEIKQHPFFTSINWLELLNY